MAKIAETGFRARGIRRPALSRTAASCRRQVYDMVGPDAAERPANAGHSWHLSCPFVLQSISTVPKVWGNSSKLRKAAPASHQETSKLHRSKPYLTEPASSRVDPNMDAQELRRSDDQLKTVTNRVDVLRVKRICPSGPTIAAFE